jgi:hypothetical protein
MPELAPGMFTELFAKLGDQVIGKSMMAIEAAATAVKDRAKQSVSQQSHPYGTKTPASPGGPPAMISGTLAGSIGQSAVELGFGSLSVKVGMIPGNFPYYSGRTPSSLYAKYLETTGAGRSGVRYPFLADALHDVGKDAATAAFRAAFSGGWAGI